jgi:hypothetical protein
MTIDYVPILGGHNGHIKHLEWHIQSLEGSRSTTTTTYCNGGGRLACDVGTIGVEGSLYDSEQSPVRLAVIYGRANDDSIHILELGRYAIADVVIEDTTSQALCKALSARRATSDGFVAYPYDFAIYALCG